MPAPNRTALVEVEPRARPRGRPQTRRRQRAPVVRRRTQRSPVHSDLAGLDQESSSCSSIERSILQSIFRFRHESSICSCSSPEPLFCSMIRNDSSPSSCQNRWPCGRARGWACINSEHLRPTWLKPDYPGRLWELGRGKGSCFRTEVGVVSGAPLRNFWSLGRGCIERTVQASEAPLRNFWGSGRRCTEN